MQRACTLRESDHLPDPWNAEHYCEHNHDYHCGQEDCFCFHNGYIDSDIPIKENQRKNANNRQREIHIFKVF